MKTNCIFKTLTLLFFVFSATAQQGINYKAIIKDANGDALINTTVTIQFTILENGTTNIFQETHNPATDINGIIIVNIGEGTILNGDFNSIDWGSNLNFLKTEIDSGDGLINMGTTEFKTVPYAIHANNTLSKDYVDNQIASLQAILNNLTAGLTFCNGVFVDLNTDEQNCGECGTSCPEGFICKSGECVEPTPD